MKWLNYLFPKRLEWYARHGGRVISPYRLTSAQQEELLLMQAGVARSPEDARYLLYRHGTTRAREVLRHIRPRPVPTLRSRIAQLIKKLDGHNPRDPYGKPGYEEPTIRVTYRYRNRTGT